MAIKVWHCTIPLKVLMAALTLTWGAVTVTPLAAVICTCAVGALMVTPLESMRIVVCELSLNLDGSVLIGEASRRGRREWTD